MLYKVFRQLLHGHAVDARCSLVCLDLFQCRLAVFPLDDFFHQRFGTGRAFSPTVLHERFGPRGHDLRLAGLCDAREEPDFRRGLERAGFGSNLTRAAMEQLGFFVCVADLEDELIRALGIAVVERIVSDPTAAQVHVYIGHLGITRNNPDFYKLLVMDNVLGTGPGFTDRLSATLRAQSSRLQSRICSTRPHERHVRWW